MLNTLAFEFGATIETCIWLQPFNYCIFKAKSLAVCKCWVKITQAPIFDRPPKLSGLSLCGAQIYLPPTQDRCLFRFDWEVLTLEVLTHEMARKENFCCCCGGQSCMDLPHCGLSCPPHSSLCPTSSLHEPKPAAGKERKGIKYI